MSIDEKRHVIKPFNELVAGNEEGRGLFAPSSQKLDGCLKS